MGPGLPHGSSALSHSEDSQTRRDLRYWAMVWGTGTMAQQVCVALSTTERELLMAIAGDRTRLRKHVERARIVLASPARHSPLRLSQGIALSVPTVWRLQRRFADSGV